MSNSCIIKFDNGRKTYLLLLFFFLGNTNFQKLITFHNSKTTAVFKRRSSGSADFLSLHSKLNQQIIKINPLLNLPLWRTLMYSFTVSCNIFFQEWIRLKTTNSSFPSIHRKPIGHIALLGNYRHHKINFTE